MIVYLAGAIQAFVMYCVNGTSRSSLLIESTDSMVESTDSEKLHSKSVMQLLYIEINQQQHTADNIIIHFTGSKCLSSESMVVLSM